jgi:hypothetical protein
MAAGPVLELEAGNALELAFIVGDESDARGFGMSSNPEIIATDPLPAGLERGADLAVGCRRVLRQRNHGQERYKPRQRFQRTAALLASLRAVK